LVRLDANGAPCQTQSSDTGAAPATFASPWPYVQPSPASQAGAAPAPPAVRAVHVAGRRPERSTGVVCNLSPVLHNGGLCTVNGSRRLQSIGRKRQVQLHVQVMGDVSRRRLDGFVSTTPATATVTVTPVTQGSCTMIVQDQYGEQVQIGINVAAPSQNFSTWPATLVVGAGGAAVGITSAGAVYTGPCYAQAFGTSESVDTTLPASIANALGISVTTDGCILNADGSAPYGGSTPTGVMVAYEPAGSGQTGNFHHYGLQPAQHRRPGSRAIAAQILRFQRRDRAQGNASLISRTAIRRKRPLSTPGKSPSRSMPATSRRALERSFLGRRGSARSRTSPGPTRAEATSSIM
jgi:hypothetical protein